MDRFQSTSFSFIFLLLFPLFANATVLDELALYCPNISGSTSGEQLCCNLPKGKTCAECREAPEDCPGFGKKTKVFVLPGKGDSIKGKNGKLKIREDGPSGKAIKEMESNRCLEIVPVPYDENTSQKDLRLKVAKAIADNLTGQEAAGLLAGHSQGGTLALSSAYLVEGISEIMEVPFSIETFGSPTGLEYSSWQTEIAHLWGLGLAEYTADMASGNINYPATNGDIPITQHIHEKTDVVSRDDQWNFPHKNTTIKTYSKHNHETIITDVLPESLEGIECVCEDAFSCFTEVVFGIGF